jgi:hypothetical protein
MRHSLGLRPCQSATSGDLRAYLSGPDCPRLSRSAGFPIYLSPRRRRAQSTQSRFRPHSRRGGRWHPHNDQILDTIALGSASRSAGTGVTIEPLSRHPFHDARRQIVRPPGRKPPGPLVEQRPASELFSSPTDRGTSQQLGRRRVVVSARTVVVPGMVVIAAVVMIVMVVAGHRHSYSAATDESTLPSPVLSSFHE